MAVQNLQARLPDSPSGATVSPGVVGCEMPAQPVTPSATLCRPLLYAAAATSASSSKPAGGVPQREAA